MKYMVNNHSYEGLAGETCDWAEFYPSYKDALSAYLGQKEIVGQYQDSFVQLIEFCETSRRGTVLRAYYAEEYQIDDPYDGHNFFAGEYIRTIPVRDEDGEIDYVRYDETEIYNKEVK